MTSPNDNETEYVSETFVGLDLTNEHLVRKEFDSCVFKECDFSNTIIESCKFIECEFLNCNLSLVNPKYSKFMDVTFNESKLVGVDWTKATWSNMHLPAPIEFYKCVLNDCSFYGLYLAELKMEDCRAHDVDFREGDFHESNFSSTDFTSSIFNGADLSTANFEFAENYYIDINTTRIQHAKFSRHEAVNLLESLDIELLD
jgi:uncharacterized protein YjbI with pentapeptide repeats